MRSDPRAGSSACECLNNRGLYTFLLVFAGKQLHTQSLTSLWIGLEGFATDPKASATVHGTFVSPNHSH